MDAIWRTKRAGSTTKPLGCRRMFRRISRRSITIHLSLHLLPDGSGRCRPARGIARRRPPAGPEAAVSNHVIVTSDERMG
eukprot:scaffold3422_cov34-Prasinocladus_malaysianus.AAC.1